MLYFSAIEISELMNKSVKPCTDFYNFACGNYPKTHPIPKWTNEYDPFVEVQTKIIKLVRGIF